MPHATMTRLLQRLQQNDPSLTQLLEHDLVLAFKEELEAIDALENEEDGDGEIERVESAITTPD